MSIFEFDYKRTMQAIFKSVNETPDVSSGISQLLKYSQEEAPSEMMLWNHLAQQDYAADYRLFSDGFGASLKASPIPAIYTGYYVGLDGLNMPNGKGIEFGCSKTFDEANDDGGVAWAYQGNYYPFEIESPLLSALYTGIVEQGSLADHTVCIAYVGLAVRDALRELPIADTLGEAKARAVCWGPHDGELCRLGILRHDGLKVDCQWRR